MTAEQLQLQLPADTASTSTRSYYKSGYNDDIYAHRLIVSPPNGFFAMVPPWLLLSQKASEGPVAEFMNSLLQ